MQTVSDNEETGNETLNKSLDEEKGLERSQINEELINLQAMEQLKDKTQNKTFKSPKKRYTKQRKTDKDSKITKVLGYLQQTTAVAQQRKDQCSLFGDYIADKLRSFDNRLRAIAQNRISNVLFDLEINLYQNPSIHTSMQSPFPVNSNFYKHRTQHPHNQIDTRNPAFNDQFSRLPISTHHSTSFLDSSHFQQINRSSTPQNSNNQPSTSSTPVSYVSSPYPSP